MGDIIYNRITKQGDKRDIAQNFTINDAIEQQYSAKTLRAVVASESIPRKVVDFLPKTMADVGFDVEVAGSASSENTEDTIWVTDQLKRLIPWVTEAQIMANIVGKAYVVFDRYQTLFDEERLNDLQSIPKRGGADNLNPDVEDIQVVGTESEDQNGLLDLFSTPVIADSAEDFELTPDEQLKEVFPLAYGIEWTEEIIDTVYGVQILPGDFYSWTSDGNYLYKSLNSAAFSDGSNTTANKKTILSSRQLSEWLEDKKKDLPDKSESFKRKFQTEIIHRSHVIELFAFDYQDDSVYAYKKGPVKVGANTKSTPKQSYRLTRFIPAFLRYSSFINATLNRIHRSEFLAYAKENLGDLAQDIAKALAIQERTTGTNIPEIGTTEVNEVIKQELERIMDSATNMGIVMYDKKHKLDIVSRTFTGVKDFNNIFRDGLISASGLTEFVLFGINSAGTGLASMDIRDRKFIADQADSLWADHWVPPLIHIANLLALTRDDVNLNVDVLKINLEKSFKLTDSEMSEWIQRVIDSRIKLLEQRVLTPAMVLRELASDSMLGKHFLLIKEDVEKHIERLMRLTLEEMGSANKGAGEYPTRTAEIKAEAEVEKAKLQAEAKTKSSEIATVDAIEDKQAEANETKEQEIQKEIDVSTTKNADAREKWQIQGSKTWKEWKALTNMSDEELRSWIRSPSISLGNGRSGRKSGESAHQQYAKRVLSLRKKSLNSMTPKDFEILSREVETIKRFVNTLKKKKKLTNSRGDRKVLSREVYSLLSHGVKLPESVSFASTE